MAHRRTASRPYVDDSPTIFHAQLPPMPLSPSPLATLPKLTFSTPTRSMLHSFRKPLPRTRAKILTIATILSALAYFLIARPYLLNAAISSQPIDLADASNTSNSNRPFGLSWDSAVHSSKQNLPRKRPHNGVVHRKLSQHPQLPLDRKQELAAVSNFLASLPQNAIPLSVDPSLPIDPQLVLDFDTRSADAEKEMQAIMDEVWARNPVILFCKLHSPVSRELKAILADMHLSPPPLILDVDQRTDASVLIPLLTRLTETPSLPILLIGGTPTGSMTEIRMLKESGELRRMVQAAGASIGDGRKKKGRK